MSRYALIAVGYNRKKGMMRLLKSLSNAEYFDEKVDLIVSIDNSGKDDVLKCANEFEWPHGNKTVITYPERLGLRRHILKCGEFVENYDAIAVFEDDIVVSPGFYQYMKKAIGFYQCDDKVAGISFYNHLWNVNADLPFEPAYSEFDTYFLQFAQSWGQIWMKKQWHDFTVWYESNKDSFPPMDHIPDSVCNWPETSWLKYHIRYCIEKNKFFVYPYKSLSTCFSDAGQHRDKKDTFLQVSMLQTIKKEYSFADITHKNAVKYDAFFERILENTYDCPADDLCLDLYGSRKSFFGKRYILSSRSLPFAVLQSYALDLKPHEMNYIYKVDGNDLFLYDSSVSVQNKLRADKINFRYYYRLHGRTREMMQYISENLIAKFKNK